MVLRSTPMAGMSECMRLGMMNALCKLLSVKNCCSRESSHKSEGNSLCVQFIYYSALFSEHAMSIRAMCVGVVTPVALRLVIHT